MLFNHIAVIYIKIMLLININFFFWESRAFFYSFISQLGDKSAKIQFDILKCRDFQ